MSKIFKIAAVISFIIVIAGAIKKTGTSQTSYAQNQIAMPESFNQIHTITWSDADSGKINGLKFRVNSGDAPETGRLGQKSGAECQAEIILGKKATDYVRALKPTDFKVTGYHGIDRYERHLVDLAYLKENYLTHQINIGYMKSWLHQGTRALEPHPNWCSAG